MNVKELKINVDQQGPCIVNNGWVIEESFNLIAIEIDMKSKYCDIGGMGSSSDGDCFILIDANENTLYLDETKDKDSFTQISFPDYKGWEVFATYSGRYTIRVVLKKINQD